jgi:O-methyltransferase
MIKKDVLEIGSGRGGGCYYLKDYLGAHTVTGFDLSTANIELSDKMYARDNISFQQGAAENLPYNNASFHIVVNVEFSHYYPLIDRFFSKSISRFASRRFFPLHRFYKSSKMGRCY